MVLLLAALILLYQLAFAQEPLKSKLSLEDFEYSSQKELINNFAHHIWSGSSESEVILETSTVQQGASSLGLIYKPVSSSGWVAIQKDLTLPLNWQD